MNKLAHILLVEDNEEDVEIIKINFKKEKISNPMTVVSDGETALNFLFGDGEFTERILPDLVLLDINIPRIDGKEVLSKIKADQKLKKIPVVMLTTSKNQEDVDDCYSWGAAGYIRKPVDFEGIKKVVKLIDEYWFGIVTLPTKPK